PRSAATVPLLLLSSLLVFVPCTATTVLYTLSLHAALPICDAAEEAVVVLVRRAAVDVGDDVDVGHGVVQHGLRRLEADLRDGDGDRKSTRLNSSHVKISYAVFCLKKKNYRTRDVHL